MTDFERAEHAARLRGLLYLACLDAPAWAIESTAESITQHANETPGEPVPEAAHLSQTQQQPSDADRLTGARLAGVNLSDADLDGANLRDAYLNRADLTGAILTGAMDMRLPERAIWNRETLWPANLALDIAGRSDEVSPGVYQVRGGGGQSPDRDIVRV